jgi:hypothetical protein
VKQNTYFREVFGMKRMLLHASEMMFLHPYSDETIYIQAPVDEEFARALEITNLLGFLPGISETGVNDAMTNDESASAQGYGG